MAKIHTPPANHGTAAVQVAEITGKGRMSADLVQLFPWVPVVPNPKEPHTNQRWFSMAHDAAVPGFDLVRFADQAEAKLAFFAEAGKLRVSAGTHLNAEQLRELARLLLSAALDIELHQVAKVERCAA